MSDAWIDRLWMTVGLGLLVVACAGFAWAMTGDGVRGWRARRAGNATRRRCGKCWYDMTGVAGLRCPECGREARHERGLMRSRIRWRGVLVNLAVLLPAHVAASMPTVRAHGWGRLVPMVVLASWPMNLDAWIKGTSADWAGKELDDRLKEELFGPLSQRVLAERVRQLLARDRRTDESVEVFPVGDLVREMRFEPAGVRTWGAPSHVFELAMFIQDAIHSDEWTYYSGESARLEHIGERLIVRAPAGVMSEVRNLLSAMRAGEGWLATYQGDDTVAFNLSHRSPSVVHAGDLTVIGMSLAHGAIAGPNRRISQQADARGLVTLLTNVVDQDSWTDNGGEGGSLHAVAERILIRAPKARRLRCVELLEAIQSCSAQHRFVESGGLSIASLDRLPGVIDDPERGLVVNEDQWRNLRRILVEAVSRDAWSDNGGDGAYIFPHKHVLVMGGEPSIRARACEVIDAVLATATDGQPRRCEGSRCYRNNDSDPLSESRLEYVTTWKITGSTLRAWGAQTDEEITADNGGISPQEWARTGPDRNRAVVTYDAEESERHAFSAVVDHVKTIRPQAWEESARIELVFGNVALLWTTKPEVVDEVEAALREAAKGPRPDQP
ncbi:MAG: hypothetical protein AABZ53_13515 [Planctomycetota bacterium]